MENLLLKSTTSHSSLAEHKCVCRWRSLYLLYFHFSFIKNCVFDKIREFLISFIHDCRWFYFDGNCAGNGRGGNHFLTYERCTLAHSQCLWYYLQCVSQGIIRELGVIDFIHEGIEKFIGSLAGFGMWLVFCIFASSTEWVQK